jgi:hypothetical protein
MAKRTWILLLVCTVAHFGFAKDKNKNLLPTFVLEAHTVAVLIEPGAGMSIEDPRANEVAQKDVETALLNWGRLEPILSKENADLIIVIRKGNGRMMNETFPDPRQNNRAGVINPNDNGIGIGGQRGPQQPGGAQDDGLGSTSQNTRPRSEIGDEEDSFVVYRGNIERPLNDSPVWRFMSKDGLRGRDVPAVAAFRKAIADTEKAAAKKP